MLTIVVWKLLPKVWNKCIILLLFSWQKLGSCSVRCVCYYYYEGFFFCLMGGKESSMGRLATHYLTILCWGGDSRFKWSGFKNNWLLGLPGGPVSLSSIGTTLDKVRGIPHTLPSAARPAESPWRAVHIFSASTGLTPSGCACWTPIVIFFINEIKHGYVHVCMCGWEREKENL